MSLRKCVMFTRSCKLRRRVLADTSANHMKQAPGLFVSHIVESLYAIALLAIVHMCLEYQERYSL